MVERYRNMIGGSGMPNARVENHVDATAAGAGVAAALDRAGDGMRVFAQVTRQKRDERDMDIVEKAMNQYNQGMLGYLGDPQKGVLWDPKYRGEGAEWLTDGFAARSDALRDGIADGLKMNAAQRTAFARVSERAALPYYRQLQAYEREQTQAGRDALMRQTEAVARQRIAANPEDPDATAAAMEIVAASIGSHGLDRDEAEVDAETARKLSIMEVVRFQALGQKDPVRAEEVLRTEAKHLLPEHREILVGWLTPLAERQRTAASVERAVAAYGFKDPAAAEVGITEEYEGPERERVLAGYRFAVEREKKRVGAVRHAIAVRQDEGLNAIMDALLG